MYRFFVGVDLGQMNDYTAIAIIDRQARWKDPDAFPGTIHAEEEKRKNIVYKLYLRHLERLELGTPYPEQVRRVKQIINSPNLTQESLLIVDTTGVGRAVVDIMREEKLNPTPIVITAGFKTALVNGEYHVPKVELMTTLQTAMQMNKLAIGATLPLAAALVNELQNFSPITIKQSGKDGFEAWRESVHDDLVLALALSVWYAEKNPPMDWGGKDAAEGFDPLQ